MTERKAKNYIPFGRSKLPTRPRKLAPLVGQLPDGRYAVFNLEGTKLYRQTFSSQDAANEALRNFYKEKTL